MFTHSPTLSLPLLGAAGNRGRGREAHFTCQRGEESSKFHFSLIHMTILVSKVPAGKVWPTLAGYFDKSLVKGLVRKL